MQRNYSIYLILYISHYYCPLSAIMVNLLLPSQAGACTSNGTHTRRTHTHTSTAIRRIQRRATVTAKFHNSFVHLFNHNRNIMIGQTPSPTAPSAPLSPTLYPSTFLYHPLLIDQSLTPSTPPTPVSSVAHIHEQPPPTSFDSQIDSWVISLSVLTDAW